MSRFDLAFTSALVDFVWQGTLVAMALQLALFAARRRAAQVRYALSVAAMVVLIALPIVTTASRYERSDRDRANPVSPTQFSVVAKVDVQRVEPVSVRSEPSRYLTSLQPWVLPLWSLGVLLLSLRLVAGGFEVHALRRRARRADEPLRARVSQLARRMGIRREVDVVTSIQSDSPGAIGWLRPLILLPPATVMGLTTTQLDAVLAHELAHIRRHDYLINIAQMLVETLLFYHPAVWWVSSRLRIERELCCDDEAVRVCGDRTAYARALVTMARLHTPGMAMAATGGSLRDRVHRLLGLPAEARSAKVGLREARRPAALSVIVIVVTIVLIAFAHVGAQNERPRFDVASIKPVTEGGPGFFSGSLVYPGGVVRNPRVPLFLLIAVAYDVPMNRVEGTSELLKERYAIDARASTSALPAPGPTIRGTVDAQLPVVRDMLKTLLAERFNLAIHVEKRDTPVYLLVVNGKTRKLTPAAKNCEPTTIAEFDSPIGPCGLRGGGPAKGYHVHGAELSELASGLSLFVGRPIIDRTGISGRFDIDVPPWSTGAPPRLDSDEPQPDPDGPSLFTVLQQLGLRLEPSRAPIDYYVVDHVERPSEN